MTDTPIERLKELLAKATETGAAVDRAPKEGEIRMEAVAAYHRAALELQIAAVKALPELIATIERRATIEPIPSAGEGERRVREIVDLWFAPWGAAKGVMWENLSGDKPFDPNVALELIRDALPSEPLRDD